MAAPATEPVPACEPAGDPVLAADEADAAARVFRALGDPARVRILNLLATSAGPVCVCHLQEPLGLAQPTVSHHLKTLHGLGLLERRQRGRWAHFSLAPDAPVRLGALAGLVGGRS